MVLGFLHSIDPDKVRDSLGLNKANREVILREKLPRFFPPLRL